jgi:hypothetical protein
MQFITCSGKIHDTLEPHETDFKYRDLIKRLKNNQSEYQSKEPDINNIRPYELCVSYGQPNLIKCNNNQPINLDDEIDWSSDVFITFGKCEYWCCVIRKKTNQKIYKKIKSKTDDKKSIEKAYEFIWKKYLYQNPTSIKYMIEQTEEKCNYVFNKYPPSLEFIDDKYKTKIMYENAVKKNYKLIKYIPFNMQTKDLYKKAIQENIRNISYISRKELLNDDLVSFIISYNPIGMIYNYFDVKYQTEELWIKIFNICNNYGMFNNIENIIKKIDKTIFTKKICESLINNFSCHAFEHIPYEMKTSELCKLAVKNSSFQLRYVPEELKTSELCKFAVNSSCDALQYVPNELKTEELFKFAVNRDGYALRYVPDKFKTEELCKIAVNSDGYALRYVPDKFKTEELCKIAMNSSCNALQYVPNELKTEELCKFAVNRSGYALRYVPDKFKTEELCKIALNKERNLYGLINFVPKLYRHLFE